MKQKFENEPLDFEYKPVKRSFRLVFSIEGILFFVVMVCMYTAYLLYITGIIPDVYEYTAFAIAMVINVWLYVWQLLGAMFASASGSPPIIYDWKIKHSKRMFFLYILIVLITVLMSVLNCGESFENLVIIFLIIIQHGLTWFYMINCFVRRKAENEPEISN
jgi:hypothetical protein